MKEANKPKANIRELQRMLRELAQLTGAKITLVSPDGIFGPETRRAVEEFQRQYDLPVTGEADSGTWNCLAAAERKVRQSSAPPSAVRVLSAGFTGIGPGEEGDAVLLVQIMLRTLAGCYSNLPDTTISGVYDEQTAKAVETFRQAVCLPPGKAVDRDVWERLTALYNAEL